MDKYEFNIKVEQLRKLVNKGDYETAMKIADTIEWRKVRNANLLAMVSEIYEKNAEYSDAKDILLLAYEHASIGKRFLFKLTERALKEGNAEEAERYYREFSDMAGDDSRQYLLRYMVLKAKNAPVEQMLHALERYTAEELDEKWLYELAELYHQIGDVGKCVSTCDKIMLMFGLGKYVDKAMDLKIQYAPLTNYQMDLVENREKYEAKLRAVEQSFQDVTYREDDDADTPPADEWKPVPETKAKTRPQAEEDTEASAEAAEISADQQEDETISDKVKNHLMVEARTPEQGLTMALDALKKIQQETGIKNPVAKISGSRLNERGILVNSEKLSGKDIVIEQAGDMNETTMRELEQFMSSVASETRVILIDNPRQMEMFHARNPQLATHFECIASPDAFKKKAQPDAEKVTKTPMDTESGSEETAEEPAPKEIDSRPVRRVTPVNDGAMRAPEKKEQIEPPTGDEEMDIDAFAQYACQYASQIDCNVSGKSMLALYERIEIMEEDSIPLTRANAEALIEEAADKAEKKSLKRLFSSKYDKEGLLILREEHFIS